MAFKLLISACVVVAGATGDESCTSQPLPELDNEELNAYKTTFLQTKLTMAEQNLVRVATNDTSEPSEEELAEEANQADAMNAGAPAPTPTPLTPAVSLSIDEAEDWWWLTQYAYTDFQMVLATGWLSGAPSLASMGWKEEGVCKVSATDYSLGGAWFNQTLCYLVGLASGGSCNMAKAKVFSKIDDPSVLAIGFSGTDFYSIKDWITNFEGAWSKVTPNNHPAGFEREVQALHACLIDKLDGRQAAYVVGHSQGGSDATIYWRLTNQGALTPNPLTTDSQVITFGAGKTTWRSVASYESAVPGHRYYHSEDPVASNVGGSLDLFEGFRHDVKNAHVLYRSCKSKLPGACTLGWASAVFQGTDSCDSMWSYDEKNYAKTSDCPSDIIYPNLPGACIESFNPIQLLGYHGNYGKHLKAVQKTKRNIVTMCPTGYKFSHAGYWKNYATGNKAIDSEGATLAQCASKCGEMPSCVAFNLAEGTRCWLYSSLGTKLTSPISTACVRNQPVCDDSGWTCNTCRSGKKRRCSEWNDKPQWCTRYGSQKNAEGAEAKDTCCACVNS